MRILSFVIWLLFPSWGYCLSVADIANRLPKSPITQGEFKQAKYLQVLQKPLLSNGKFIYQQGKGIIWEVITPLPSTLLLSPAKVRTSQGDQAIPVTYGQIFTALISGDLISLSNNFELATEAFNAGWQVILQPKDELLKKVLVKVLLKGDTEVRQVVLYEVGNNRTEIDFDHIIHPAQLSQEQAAGFAKFVP